MGPPSQMLRRTKNGEKSYKFWKGIWLLLLGWFKVILQTLEVISSRMPVSALRNMQDKLPFIKIRSSWTNNIRWITRRNFSEEDIHPRVSNFQIFVELPVPSCPVSSLTIPFLSSPGHRINLAPDYFEQNLFDKT